MNIKNINDISFKNELFEYIIFLIANSNKINMNKNNCINFISDEYHSIYEIVLNKLASENILEREPFENAILKLNISNKNTLYYLNKLDYSHEKFHADAISSYNSSIIEVFHFMKKINQLNELNKNEKLNDTIYEIYFSQHFTNYFNSIKRKNFFTNSMSEYRKNQSSRAYDIKKLISNNNFEYSNIFNIDRENFHIDSSCIFSCDKKELPLFFVLFEAKLECGRISDKVIDLIRAIIYLSLYDNVRYVSLLFFNNKEALTITKNDSNSLELSNLLKMGDLKKIIKENKKIITIYTSSNELVPASKSNEIKFFEFILNEIRYINIKIGLHIDKFKKFINQIHTYKHIFPFSQQFLINLNTSENADIFEYAMLFFHKYEDQYNNIRKNQNVIEYSALKTNTDKFFEIITNACADNLVKYFHDLKRIKFNSMHLFLCIYFNDADEMQKIQQKLEMSCDSFNKFISKIKLDMRQFSDVELQGIFIIIMDSIRNFINVDSSCDDSDEKNFIDYINDDLLKDNITFLKNSWTIFIVSMLSIKYIEENYNNDYNLNCNKFNFLISSTLNKSINFISKDFISNIHFKRILNFIYYEMGNSNYINNIFKVDFVDDMSRNIHFDKFTKTLKKINDFSMSIKRKDFINREFNDINSIINAIEDIDNIITDIIQGKFNLINN